MPLLPTAQTGGYGLLEPLAHGTKQVHEQASSSSSAVENLQPEQLARSSYCVDCISRSVAQNYNVRYDIDIIVCVGCGITFRAKMQWLTLNIAKIFAPAAGRPPPIPHTQNLSLHTSWRPLT